MSKAAAKTGIGPTAGVAVEQFVTEKQRGIDNELSYRILPFTIRSFVSFTRFRPIRDWVIRSVEKKFPGIWAGMICRKRFIHEKLADSVEQMKAVINLGAGFDTQTYGLACLNTLIYEVDQPEIIQKKKKQLLRIFGEMPSFLKLVPVDFDNEDLNSALQSRGYSPGIKTFFLLEGVTQYLTEKGIQETFNFLSGAAPGSQLVFTYVRKDLIEGKVLYGWENAYNKFVLKDGLWVYGMDPDKIPDFCRKYGWQVTEDSGYDELHGKYVEPTGREYASTLVERIVYAKKQ